MRRGLTLTALGNDVLNAAATNTGQVAWSLWYRPLAASGVSVVVA